MANVSLGFEYSPTTVEAPIFNEHGAQVKFNENGCCAIHPDIVLREEVNGIQKIRNGGNRWRVLRSSCHKCDEIYSLDVQQKRNEYELQSETRSIMLEHQKRESKREQLEAEATLVMESLKLHRDFKKSVNSSDELCLSSDPTAACPNNGGAKSFSTLLKKAKDSPIVTLAGKKLQKLSEIAAEALPVSKTYMKRIPITHPIGVGEHGEYRGFYTGEVNEATMKPHGQGEFFNPLGEGDRPLSEFTYIGSFEKGLMHGVGKLVHSDKSDVKGLIYEGDFKKGVLDGYGEITMPDIKFIGEFKGGHPVKGSIAYSNGNHYEGELNKVFGPHGKGVLTYSSKSIYRGHFVDGKMHGHGVYMFANGHSYDGDFKDGYMHGCGKYFDGKKTRRRRVLFDKFQ